ncbi:MAG: hypothetical protein D6720_11785 [Gammaproteobacteria bacterium]|nr:MAG: hypothetical protein D6720_11785 [Gammaproteobacteria bacterium]
MPLAVLGMVSLLLLMAGLARRHQEYQALQRERLRRLVAGIESLEVALESLKGIPLASELRNALRGDLHRAWLQVQAIHRNYPGLAQRIDEAAMRLQGDGGVTQGRVPAVEDQAACNRLLDALDRVSAHLGNGLGEVSRSKGMILVAWRREIQERRAEVLARFHVVAARQAQQAGDNGEAVAHLQQLLEELARRGPDTDFVRELYAEAERLYRYAVQGRSLGEAVAGEGEETLGQRSNRSSAA